MAAGKKVSLLLPGTVATEPHPASTTPSTKQPGNHGYPVDTCHYHHGNYLSLAQLSQYNKDS